MSRKMVFLPQQWSIQAPIAKNPLMQLRRTALHVECRFDPIKNGHLCVWSDNNGSEHRTLILCKKLSKLPMEADEVLITPNGEPLESRIDWELNRGKIRWVSPVPASVSAIDMQWVKDAPQNVLASWKGQFSFKEEGLHDDGTTAIEGLRPPQIGALHAILSHWTVETAPATIVMPTGTGKTETMLSLLVCQCPPKVLIMVPSVALREQITAKVASLGVLKGKNGWGGIVSDQASFPVVGKLEHGFKNAAEAELFFSCANVIVANVDALSACSLSVRERLANWCSHLFVDETHHSAAATWSAIRLGFKIKEKPILGFTATPYRNDDKLVEGRVIYSYPLSKAQKEGYFTPITFIPVSAYSEKKSDVAIAHATVKQLEEDTRNGYSHLVMARAANVERAKIVHGYYQELAPEHDPQLIYSALPKEEQRAVLHRIRTGQSRIVVCVDMFGEGFDLPELKIAAMHDIHKSLAITLQFTGRFTRGRSDLGSATLIANTAYPDVQDSLRALYAEDPNWNTLLQQLSGEATGRQIVRTEFLRGFDEIPGNLPVQNVCPPLSAETYITNCDSWNPHALEPLLPKKQILVPPVINYDAKVIVFVTRQEIDVKWVDARDLRDVSNNLHLIHFDEKRKLLFINSPDSKQIHERWAKAICDSSAELVEGEKVFRALSGLNRMILLSAGLKDTLSHAVRFMMLMGPDVREALKTGQMENRVKSNLFTRGFRHGQRTSVGCSAKGRIWTQAVAEDVSEWVSWCSELGERLTDDSVNMEQVLRNALIPEMVSARPDAIPIAFEWSENTLRCGEESIFLEFKGKNVPFFDAELQVVNFSRNGNLSFRVRMEAVTPSDKEGEIKTDTLDAEYEIHFLGNNFSYHPIGEELFLSTGRKKNRISLSQWLNVEPLSIRFHDGSWLEGNVFCKPRKERTPYDKSQIETWNWDTTDIKKESQYKTEAGERQHRTDSIQYQVIQELKDKYYDIVFDDDSSGESADVVALKVLGDRLVVHMFHCKYAKGDVGERVGDLYEVCGQAQTSIQWRRDVEGLLRHLARRNEDWETKYGITRFQKGTPERLSEILLQSRELRGDFEISIVQPGLSKNAPTQEQLDLLSTTEIYLNEVGAVPFKVICSE